MKKKKPKQEPKKRGPKPKVIDLQVFEQVASLMCPLDEIADHFGVSRDTIERRLRQPKYAEAYARARAKRKMKLRKDQFDSGSDGMLIWLGKQHLEQREKQDVTHRGDKDAPLSLKDFTLEELLKKTRDGSSNNPAKE